jgi:hypothetical protein
MKRKMLENPGRAMRVAATMPECKHSNVEPFDIHKSEVVKWLIAQPEILQAMFNFYHDRGAIVFDQEQRLWRGAWREK